MPPSHARLDGGYGWVVVAVSLYAVAVSMLIRFLFPVLLVLLLREFHWSRTVLSGVFSLHLLTYGAVAPWVGIAIDRWNRRFLLAAGGLGLGLTLCLLRWIGSPLELYLVYGLGGGLSASMLGLVPHTQIVSQWFVRRRGLALGLMVSGIGVAMLLVPEVQQVFTRVGWRAGVGLVGIAVIATVCPLTFLGQREPPIASSGGRRAAWGGVGQPGFAGIAVAFACFGCFAHLVIAHEVALLMDFGYGAAVAGASIAAIGILSLVGNVLWGAVADRHGPMLACLAALGACFATVLVLLVLSAASPPALVALQLVLFGLGFGTPTALSALAAQRFGGERFGQVFGVITFVFSIGSVIGPVAAGFVHDWLGAYEWSFVMAAAVVAAGGVAAWRGAVA